MKQLASVESNGSSNLKGRHRRAKIWQGLFFFSTIIGIIALLALLLSVADQSMGYIATKNKVDPATLSSTPLEDLSSEALIDILNRNFSKNRIKTLEKEKPLAQRSQEELLDVVIEKIVDPVIVGTWNFSDSILKKREIEQEVATKFPEATLTFRFWLTPSFITRSMSSRAEWAGVRSGLLGSLYVILVTILFAFPVGVGAAIYLEEYANRGGRINRIIQTNIDNLAGVPSIVYGMLGLAIFVRSLNSLTSGSMFGVENATGRSILSAGLTMSLLILPIIIINAQEAIRSVPNSLRLASFGLGATQWQTIWHHVLPSALPGILTGTILAISRAIGETAPLIIIGASTFLTKDPDSIFSRFSVLPIQIFAWTSRPQDQFRNIAAAAIIVLMLTLLSINAAAILSRNRFTRRI